jgi:hypothetical protein
MQSPLFLVHSRKVTLIVTYTRCMRYLMLDVLEFCSCHAYRLSSMHWNDGVGTLMCTHAFDGLAVVWRLTEVKMT